MARFATSSPGGHSRRRAAFVGVAAFLTGLAVGGTILGHGPASHGLHDRPRAEKGTADARGSQAIGALPTPTRSGVPAGFEQSNEGAVAAAAAFVATGQTLIEMDPLAAEAAIREMAAAATADDQATRLLGNLSATRTALGRGTGPIIYRQSVLAWRLEAFTPARARVAIWNVSVLSRNGIAPPQASWAISTFDLVWERSDWRIWSEAISPGPAPVLDDSTAPATSAQLETALRGFTDFGTAR